MYPFKSAGRESAVSEPTGGDRYDLEEEAKLLVTAELSKLIRFATQL